MRRQLIFLLCLTGAFAFGRHYEQTWGTGKVAAECVATLDAYQQAAEDAYHEVHDGN